MSINGGDDNFQFYGSGSYLSNEGITNGADFKRYNGMMKLDYQARKWLKIGGTARFIHTNSNSNNYSYYGSLTTPRASIPSMYAMPTAISLPMPMVRSMIMATV